MHLLSFLNVFCIVIAMLASNNSSSSPHDVYVGRICLIGFFVGHFTLSWIHIVHTRNVLKSLSFLKSGSFFLSSSNSNTPESNTIVALPTPLPDTKPREIYLKIASIQQAMVKAVFISAMSSLIMVFIPMFYSCFDYYLAVSPFAGLGVAKTFLKSLIVVGGGEENKVIINRKRVVESE